MVRTTAGRRRYLPELKSGNRNMGALRSMMNTLTGQRAYNQTGNE